MLAAGCGGTSSATSAHDGGTEAAACAADGWRTFEAQHKVFTFRAPCTMSGGPQQGADSYVGEYADTGMLLDYDYGAYSSDLSEYQSLDSYQKQSVVVGGKSGYIVTGVNPGSSAGAYVAGLYVPDTGTTGAKLSFVAACDSTARQNTAVAILKTIAF